MASPDRTDPTGASGPGPGPRAPGWYAHPDRSDLLRYWDGAHWTSRQRPRPAWVGDGSSLVVAEGRPMIDGPVRAAELEAPAAATTSAAPTRESPASQGPPAATPAATPAGPGQAGSDRRPSSAGPAGDDGGTGRGRGGGGDASGGGGDASGGGGGPSDGGGGPSDGGGPSGRGGSPSDDGDTTSATRSRRKWLFFAGVAVLAAIAVGISGEAMRPKSPGPRVLTDRSYVKAANAECAKTLPGLRPPDSGPFGQFDTPEQTAAQIERASSGLVSLAGRLRARPAAAADLPHLDGWLDGWNRYADLGRQYATFLRQPGQSNPGKLKDAIVREANTDDNFALANGLNQCTFFATPQPDPSNGF